MEEAGIKLVAENEDGFKRSMQSAQSAVDNFTGDLGGAQVQRVNGFQAALTGAFTAISGAAIEMAMQAGKAVVGFVTDSIGAAGDFEQGMSVLKAASGATAEEMKVLRETSIALGNDITLPATSAASAAEAMTELVKAGLSVEDSQNAARGALQLATAAQIDDALNTFSMDGTEAVKVADMLAAGANASAASATDIADGFKQAGAIFNASNQDADDLITALSMLTNVGYTGSDAGTALKNAFMKLNAPTKEGAAMMEALGINVFNAEGKMKPMNEVIDIFSKSMAGMTDEQKNAALATILQSDGMKAFLPLMEAGKAGFDEMNAKINENGAAAKMAGAQTEGFKGAQAALANTLDTLQLIIGTALLPILTDLVNNAILPAAQAVMGFVQSLIAGEGAAGLLVDTITGFFEMMAGGGGDVDMFYQPLIGLMEAFGMTDTAIDSALDAVDWFVGALSSAKDAIGAVLAGLQAVIMAVFGQVQAFITAHGDEIKAVMKAAWEVIQLAIQAAIMFYEKVVAPTLQKIAKWIDDHGAEIQAVFETVWNAIKFAIDTALIAIKGILTAAMQLMQGDTEGALNTLKVTFETIWNKIKAAVEGIVNNLAQNLRAKFEEIKSGITGAITGAYNAVVAQLAQWAQLGSAIITGIIDGIKSQAQALLDQIRGVIMGAIRSAINIFPEFMRPALLAFFGISANSASGFKGSSAGGAGGGFTTYGNTYNLNVTTTASAGVVMDSFAIMQAYG
jgi:TP901 family phage tail tape measure protein